MCHKKLLLKLHHCGIKGIANHLLKSYLTERKQFVSLNDITSTALTFEYGVTQGSILGPLLFLIYINDLPNSLVTTPRFFADDTAIFITIGGGTEGALAPHFSFRGGPNLLVYCYNIASA